MALAVRAGQIPVPRSFDTSAVVDEQVRQWEAHNAASLVALRCEAPEGQPFEGLEVNLQLPRIHLALVRGTRHRFARDPELIESDPADAIAVYASLRGEAVFEQDGRRQVTRPGQLLICDADRPFLRGFGHGLQEFAIKIPRTAFAELTGITTLEHPVILDARPGQDPLAHTLVRMIGRALHCTDPVPADEDAVLELASVLATGGSVDGTVAHRASARAYVEEHLHDPRMSASDIAIGAGISVRTLSRLFADVGTSVPRHILARRLDRAHGLLMNRPELRTVEVAGLAGFTSTAHFSQEFLRRFGVYAGDVRRAGGTARA